jgi:hypothetical protein
MLPAGAFAAGWVCFRSKAAVFGVPLRTRAAHVVQVGPIRAFTAETRAPQRVQGLKKIVPHGTLPSAPVAMRAEIPPSNAAGHARIMGGEAEFDKTV